MSENKPVSNNSNFTTKSEWEVFQENTFIRWANTYLTPHNLTVQNLTTDLTDGVKLLTLIYILSKHEIPQNINQNKTVGPKSNFQSLANLTQFFEILKSENIKIVNISSEDMFNGSIKLSLGLFWTMITKYQIGMALQELGSHENTQLSQKDALIAQIFSKLEITEFRGKNNINFTDDWNDGILLSGLINYLAKNTIFKWKYFNPENKLENAKFALATAEEYLNVTKLLLPEELVNSKLDEKSVMTMISSIICTKPIKPLPKVDLLITNAALKLDFDPDMLKNGIAINSDFVFYLRGGYWEENLIKPNVKFINISSNEVEVIPIDHIIENIYEIKINPKSQGNHSLEVTLADKKVQFPVTVTTPNVNRILFHPTKNFEANKPCKMFIDARYSGICFKFASLKGPGQIFSKLSSIGDKKSLFSFICTKPGDYLLNLSLKKDEYELCEFKFEVLPEHKCDYVWMKNYIVENNVCNLTIKPTLIFFSKKIDKNEIDINNKDIVCTYDITNWEDNTSSPLNGCLLSSNRIKAIIEYKVKGFYIVGIHIKTLNRRSFELTPAPILVKKALELIPNTVQKFAFPVENVENVEKMHVSFFDISGTHNNPIKTEKIQIGRKNADVFSFKIPIEGINTLRITKGADVSEYTFLVKPSLSKIEVFGLSDLQEKTYANVPTIILANIARQFPELFDDQKENTHVIRAQVNSINLSEKTEFTSEYMGYGILKVPLMFKEPGEYEINLYLDDNILPQFKTNLIVVSKPDNTCICSIIKSPQQILTHKLNKLLISFPFSTTTNYEITIKGPRVPEFKSKILNETHAAVLFYTIEQGTYNICVTEENLQKKYSEIPIEVTLNPNIRLIFGYHKVQTVSNKVKAKATFCLRNSKKASYPFFISQNAKLKCTAEDSQGLNIEINRCKINIRGGISVLLTPMNKGIHTLNISMDDNSTKLQLNPKFFYVHEIPEYNSITENSLLIYSKNYNTTTPCLIHSDSGSQLIFDRSKNLESKNYNTTTPLLIHSVSGSQLIFDKIKNLELNNMNVNEHYFKLKEYGIYHIKQSPMRGKINKCIIYPIKSIDTSEFRKSLNQVSLVNYSILASRGIPADQENCLYIDASKLEYDKIGTKCDIPKFLSQVCVLTKISNAQDPRFKQIIKTAEKCGSGYYKILVPLLKKGDYCFDFTYSNFPILKAKIKISVYQYQDVTILKHIGNSTIYAEEIMKFYVNVGCLNSKGIRVDVTGKSEVFISVCEIDLDNTIIYVYIKVHGYYELFLKNSNNLDLCSYKFKVQPSKQAIKENDFVIGMRLKAYCYNETKHFLNVFSSAPTFMQTLPGICSDELTCKLQTYQMNESNTNSILSYDSKQCEITLKMDSPTNGLHIFNLFRANYTSSLPILPIPVYIDTVDQAFSGREKTIYFIKFKNSEKCEITYYPINQSKNQISVAAQEAILCGNCCVKCTILPQKLGRHIISIKDEYQNLQTQFEVKDPENDKVIYPEEINITGGNELKLHGIWPDSTFSILVDVDAYENRLTEYAKYLLKGIFNYVTSEECSIILEGVRLGNGIYQFDLKINQESDYSVDFYYAEEKIPHDAITFNCSKTIKPIFRIVVDENATFYTNNPCQYFIDARLTDDTIKTITTKDGSPISYIISKIYLKVFSVTFLYEFTGLLTLIMTLTNNETIEYSFNILSRDSSLPDFPLLLRINPIVGIKCKIKESSSIVFIDQNNVHFLPTKLKRGVSYSGKLYSSNCKEGSLVDIVTTKSTKFKGYITPIKTGLHVLVVINKISKSAFCNFCPIPFVVVPVPTEVGGLPMNSDVSFKNIEESNLVNKTNIEESIVPSNLVDNFQRKRTKIEIIPELIGENFLGICTKKNKFIDIPFKIAENPLIQAKLSMIKVMGLETLEKYEIKTDQVYIILLDARSLEYDLDGNYNNFINVLGLKEVKVILKDSTGTKKTFQFIKVSDGMYFAELFFDKQDNFELNILYANNLVFPSSKKIIVLANPTKKIDIFKSCCNKISCGQAFYFIFYHSVTDKIRAFIKNEISGDSSIIISPMVNSFACVGIILNKEGCYTLHVEYEEYPEVFDEVEFSVDKNISEFSKNTYDLKAEYRVNLSYKIYVIPKIFLCCRWGETLFSIPDGTMINGNIVNNQNDNSKIEYIINKGMKGIHINTFLKKEKINFISLSCIINTIGLMFLPTFINVKPELVIYQNIPVTLLLRTKETLLNKIEVFFRNIVDKPRYKIIKSTDLVVENIKTWNLHLICFDVGNCVLKITKTSGKSRKFEFQVKKFSNPILNPFILNFILDRSVYLKPNVFLSVDCSTFSQEDKINLKIKLEQESDEKSIKFDSFILNPQIDDNYANFLMPEEIKDGSFDISFLNKKKCFLNESVSLKVDRSLPNIARFITLKEAKFVEGMPVEFLVDVTNCMISNIILDVSGPTKCIPWTYRIAPNIYYCTFIPLDYGMYNISVVSDKVKITGEKLRINVAEISKELGKKPLPFRAFPYSKNIYKMKYTPCITSMSDGFLFKKVYELEDSDKLELQLVSVNMDHAVSVDSLMKHPSQIEISFRSSSSGLHEIIGHIVKIDGSRIKLLPRPIDIEDNIHKVGILNKFSVQFNNIPKGYTFNLLSDLKNELAMFKSLKIKKYDNSYYIKGSYVSPNVKFIQIDTNIPEESIFEPINYEIEEFKEDDIVATQDEIFITAFKLPSNDFIEPEYVTIILFDPSFNITPVEFFIDNIQEKLFVYFTPQLSGIYYMKARYNGVNVDKSPCRIYSKFKTSFVSKTKSLIDVIIPRCSISNLDLNIVSPCGQKLTPLEYSIHRSKKHIPLSKVSLACDIKESGVYTIKSTMNYQPIMIKKFYFSVKVMPTQTCQVNQLYSVNIPKKSMTVIPKMGTFKTKVKVFENYSCQTDILLETIIQTAKDNEEEVTLTLTPICSGLYIFNPTTDSNIPIFYKSIEIYVNPLAYEVYNQPLSNKNYSCKTLEICYLLEEFPIFKAIALCDIDRLVISFGVDDENFKEFPLLKSSKGSLAFIMNEPVKLGNYKVRLTRNGKNMSGSPIKVEIVAPDNSGNIKNCFISKSSLCSPVLYYKNINFPCILRIKDDDSVLIDFVPDEYSIYHVDIFNNLALTKSKNILVVPLDMIEIDRLYMVSLPSIKKYLPNISAEITNPFGRKYKVLVEEFGSNLISIDATMTRSGSHKISFFDKKGRDIGDSSLDIICNKADQNTGYGELIEINKECLCSFPMPPTLIDKSDREINEYLKCVTLYQGTQTEFNINQLKINTESHLVEIKFTPTKAGLHYVSVIDSTPDITSISPLCSFFAHKKSCKDHLKVIAIGKGLKAALCKKEAFFKVSATKLLKKKINVFSDDSSISFTCKYLQLNTIGFSYTSNSIGNMLIHILYEGENISGSPYNVCVSDENLINLDRALDFVPIKTIFYNLNKTIIEKFPSIHVELIDPKRNILSCEYTLCDPTPDSKSVKMMVKFHPTRNGVYLIRIYDKTSNQLIIGSEKSFNIQPWYYISKKKFEFAGMGIVRASVGKNNCFILMSKNDIEFTRLKFGVTGSSNSDCSLTIIENNRFYAVWKPFEEGEYVLTVTYEDDIIEGMPIKVIANNDTVSIPFIKDECFNEIYGEGLRNAWIDVPNIFNVRYKAEIDHEPQVKILTDRNELTFNSTIFKGKNQNLLTVCYVPELTALHTIEIKLDGNHMQASPYQVHPERLVSFPHLVKCFGIENISKYNLLPSELIIDASYAGEGCLKVDIQAIDQRLDVFPAISKVKNKIYIVKFKFHVATDYNIAITWNGIDIPSSPIKLVS